MRSHATELASGSSMRLRRLSMAGATLFVAFLFALLVAALASAAAPTTTVEAPTEVTYTSAHLKGTINPEGGPSTTCWRFEFVRKAKLEASEEDWNSTNSVCLSEEDSAKAEVLPVSADLSNLRGGTVYLVRLTASNDDGEGTSSSEEFKTKDVTPPSVTIDPVGGITGYTATFAGTVNPNAPEPAPTSSEVEAGYRTSWHFECEPSCAGGSGEVAADSSAAEVEHEDQVIIRPDRTYTVKLVAENAGGRTVAETTFETPKVGPVVRYLPSAPVSLVTDTEARLVGLVDMRESGSLIDCHFEYGLTASYGSSVPCSHEDKSILRDDILVAGDVTGLKPETTYHFRLVAANSVESIAGADSQFTTFPATPADPQCPNEAVRVEQKATLLPGCRAWELVSPPDKNGGTIEVSGWNTPTSVDGNAVGYQSRGSFGNTSGSGLAGLTQYISRREAGGWGEARGILPVPAQDAFPVFAGYSFAGLVTEDLSHALVTALDLPQVSDDIPAGQNVYWVDTRTGQTKTLSRSFADEPSVFEFLTNEQYVRSGTSADQRVIAFTADTRLLPEAPAGVSSVYEWEEGTLRLASILPNGSISTDGASNPPVSESSGTVSREPGTVSHDGSLVTFISPKEGQSQLYIRRDHNDTIWASEPEGSAPITAPEDVRLSYITPDSQHVLFSTRSQLLDEDTNPAPDLYMYTDGPSPASEGNLTLISSGQPNESFPGNKVLGTSDDGSYVYYESSPQAYYYSGSTISLWKEGVRRDLASAAGLSEGILGYPGMSRVSADGRKLVVMSAGGPSHGYEGRGFTGLKHAEERQIYVYDDEKEMLFCASCLQAAPGAGEEPQTKHRVMGYPLYDLPSTGIGIDARWIAGRPRYLASDGSHVFFSTEEALVPEDKNEAYDAYEYDVETGQQRLLSSGRGEWHAFFTNASVDGKSAVFVSEQQLVGKDNDMLRDVYLARVDGGFAELPPPPTPCVGDGCRGTIPPTPVDSSPGTQHFAGPGNPTPKHKKNKKHKKKHKKNKKHQGRHQRGNAK